MKALTAEEKHMLLEKAREARSRSYSPYSHYAVGAALLTEDGKVYQGCNMENASYTPTVCAERTCGVCRQVMAEFCDPDFILLCGNRDESRVEMLPFEAVLPRSFGPKDLEA